MEHFGAPRNQRFSSPPTMVGSGIRPLQQSLYPLTWSLPLDTQIQILYWLFEVLVNIIRGTY